MPRLSSLSSLPFNPLNKILPPQLIVTSFYGSTGQSVTVTSPRLSLITTANAKFGTASLQGTPVQQFLGRANAVNIPLGATLSAAPFTIEAWVYMTVGYAAPDFQVSPFLYLYGGPEVDLASTSPTGARIRLYTMAANFITHSVDIYNSAGAGRSYNDNSGTINVNTWTHVALSMSNSSTLSVWINGVRKSQLLPADGLNWSGPITQLVLNAFGSGQGPQYIDEIRVSNVDRYGTGNATITVPTAEFTSDANTLALVKF